MDTGESDNNNNKLRLRSNKEGKRKGKEKGDKGGGGGGGGGEGKTFRPREKDMGRVTTTSFARTEQNKYTLENPPFC